MSGTREEEPVQRVRGESVWVCASATRLAVCHDDECWWRRGEERSEDVWDSDAAPRGVESVGSRVGVDAGVPVELGVAQQLCGVLLLRAFLRGLRVPSLFLRGPENPGRGCRECEKGKADAGGVRWGVDANCGTGPKLWRERASALGFR